MGDMIRVRICAQKPRLFLVDKLKSEGGLSPGLLALEEDEIGSAIDALKAAENEPACGHMVYVVAEQGKSVVVDRSKES